MPVDPTPAATPTTTGPDPYELEAATEILAMLTSDQLEPTSDCRADGDRRAPVRYCMASAAWF